LGRGKAPNKGNFPYPVEEVKFQANVTSPVQRKENKRGYRNLPVPAVLLFLKTP
jgi:hypothetical protein